VSRRAQNALIPPENGEGAPKAFAEAFRGINGAEESDRIYQTPRPELNCHMDTNFGASFSASFSPAEVRATPANGQDSQRGQRGLDGQDGRAPRILVIEDNEAELEIVSTLLHYNGYDVLKSESGMNGIAVARRERPDLIVCDLRLPDLHGLVIAEILKSSPETGHIPIIALSQFEALAGEIEEAGFDGYYRKPVKPAVLVTAVGKVLRRGHPEPPAPAP
jgi:CheY-like chemotaxis protein